MIYVTRIAVIASIYILFSSNAFAQSGPTSLFACLDGNGNLYGVTPSGKLGEGCSVNDLPVTLGSAGAVNTSNGLVGSINNGVLDIGLVEGLAIPPSCPPGQIPIADGDGEWICTLPKLTENPNPGAKVWIVPKWEQEYSQGADHVAIINPGSKRGRVICYTMTGLGGWVSGNVRDFSIGPASRGNCDTFSRRGDGPSAWVNGVTWLLIVSDVPVLPSARARSTRYRGHGQLQAYPIDCDYPEGYELVCDLAID
jgi:hypothetical protein